jgi:hypothetical protein
LPLVRVLVRFTFVPHDASAQLEGEEGQGVQ